MDFISRSVHVNESGVSLYTLVMLPGEGKWPAVIIRSPYYDAQEQMSDTEIELKGMEAFREFLEGGYAVIVQHCRGTGRSDGDCVPYINERVDGLALQKWIRTQPFYNGELFLYGGSYLCSVHYLTAPYAPDIKGAVFLKQDTERYNVCYRNGFFKAGLHGDWYVKMFHKKKHIEKSYVKDTFKTLPLTRFAPLVFGCEQEDWQETLRHPNREDPFWKTALGGADASHVTDSLPFPALVMTSFYDIYTGGVFDMWDAMTEETRSKCALMVNPYDHSFNETKQPIAFPKGRPEEQFGCFGVKWFDAIRGKGEYPLPRGKVTYYRLFENEWRTDDFAPTGKEIRIPFCEKDVSYDYNPAAPASFKGGLSDNFDGTAWQDEPNSRNDIRSFISKPFERETFVKGKMTAKLSVKSDCPDTCIYIRVSLVKENGTYGLRDDIHSLSEFAPDYVPGETVTIPFTFDDHAFLVKKGESIRVDVSSSAFPYYVPHTNRKGLYSEQIGYDIAHNTLIGGTGELVVPIE